MQLPPPPGSGMAGRGRGVPPPPVALGRGRGRAPPRIVPTAGAPLVPPPSNVQTIPPASLVPVGRGRGGVVAAPPVAAPAGRGAPVPVVKASPAADPLGKVPAYPPGLANKTVLSYLKQLEWPPTALYEGLRRWVLGKVPPGGMDLQALQVVLAGDPLHEQLLGEVYPGGVAELVESNPDTFRLEGTRVWGCARRVRQQVDGEAEDEARRLRRVNRDRKVREAPSDEAGMTDKQKQAAAQERAAALLILHREDLDEDVNIMTARLGRRPELLSAAELQELCDGPCSGKPALLVHALTQLERLGNEVHAGRCPPGQLEERRASILSSTAAAAAASPPARASRTTAAPALEQPVPPRGGSDFRSLPLDVIDRPEAFLAGMAEVARKNAGVDPLGGCLPVLYTGPDVNAPREIPEPPPLVTAALPLTHDVGDGDAAMEEGPAAPTTITVFGLRTLLSGSHPVARVQLAGLFANKLRQVCGGRDYDVRCVKYGADAVVLTMTDCTPLFEIINMRRQVDVARFPLLYAAYGVVEEAGDEEAQGSGPPVTDATMEDDAEEMEVWRPDADRQHGCALTDLHVAPEPREMWLTREVEWNMWTCGMGEGDMLLSSAGVFRSIEDMLQENFEPPAHAYDPCPYPNPEGLDGLVAPWHLAAKGRRGGKVYLKPPPSCLQAWMTKAVEECRHGLHIVAVLPLHSPWLRTERAMALMGRYARWPILQEPLVNPARPEQLHPTDLLAFYMDPKTHD
eukprot:TRINITY_DN27720_c0_g1_i1.p1 TRINITY_DN27720_c0_g1~~TRINITY_DN27720_c0_g1_i1.p1  ORF type:complete len:742 (+),score=216.78 TRINITY_DN27720_c0_g1_i1:80-2305(+)